MNLLIVELIVLRRNKRHYFNRMVLCLWLCYRSSESMTILYQRVSPPLLTSSHKTELVHESSSASGHVSVAVAAGGTG